MEVGSDSQNRKLLTARFDGRHWYPAVVALPAGATGGGLESVSCVSPTWCMAVGTAWTGLTVRTVTESWNGRAWRLVLSPTPGLTTGTLGNGHGNYLTHLQGVGIPPFRGGIA